MEEWIMGVEGQFRFPFFLNLTHLGFLVAPWSYFVDVDGVGHYYHMASVAMASDDFPLNHHKRKEKAKYKYFPDHGVQFRTICSLIHVFLQFCCGCFCLFIYCILSFNFCNFRGSPVGTFWQFFCLLSIYSQFLPVSPLLPSSFPLFLPSFLKLRIREAVRWDKVRIGFSSFFFCPSSFLALLVFLKRSEPQIKVWNVPKKLLSFLLVKVLAQWEKLSLTLWCLRNLLIHCFLPKNLCELFLFCSYSVVIFLTISGFNYFHIPYNSYDPRILRPWSFSFAVKVHLF